LNSHILRKKIEIESLNPDFLGSPLLPSSND